MISVSCNMCSSNTFIPSPPCIVFTRQCKRHWCSFSGPNGKLLHSFKTSLPHIYTRSILQSSSQCLNYQIGSRSRSCLLNNLFIAAFFFLSTGKKLTFSALTFSGCSPSWQRTENKNDQTEGFLSRGWRHLESGETLYQDHL